MDESNNFDSPVDESKNRTNALDDTDTRKDKVNKKLIEGLRKVGPFSKHILNYSYPPLLYQRGDDDEEDDEESQDEEEQDESTQSQDLEGDDMG